MGYLKHETNYITTVSVRETVLTDINLTHENHAINEEVFEQDSAKADDQAREIIKQMLDGNCRVINIKQALRAKGIHLSSDQIRYQIKQIVGAPVDEEKLAELLQVVKDEGGDVNWGGLDLVKES